MQLAIFSLPYFGPVSYYAALVKYEHIFIEATENYQKQTYRNRQYIYGANGKLMLNIPVKRSTTGNRLTYKNSKIENEFKWQDLHFKSLESAYRTSPYFEYYEAEIERLYQNEFTSLYEFNMKCFETVVELLGLNLQVELTKIYKKEYNNIDDCRYLVDAKNRQKVVTKSYHQVFEEKFGFISNLSILDLIFNLGPESAVYLKSINQSQP